MKIGVYSLLERIGDDGNVKRAYLKRDIAGATSSQ